MRDRQLWLLLRYEVTTWKGLPFDSRMAFRPPGCQHVPQLAHGPLPSPECEQRRLDLTVGLIVGAVLFKVDFRCRAIVLARGADGALAAITADIFRHGVGRDRARRLALDGQMIAQIIAWVETDQMLGRWRRLNLKETTKRTSSRTPWTCRCTWSTWGRRRAPRLWRRRLDDRASCGGRRGRPDRARRP